MILIDLVVAGSADDEVDPGERFLCNRVVTAPAFDQISPRTADEIVVPLSAVQKVVALVSPELVVRT